MRAAAIANFTRGISLRDRKTVYLEIIKTYLSSFSQKRVDLTALSTILYIILSQKQVSSKFSQPLVSSLDTRAKMLKKAHLFMFLYEHMTL